MRKPTANTAATASAPQPEPSAIPKTESPSETASRIRSLIRKNLIASPDFSGLYADLLISEGHNPNQAKILAERYQKKYRADMPVHSRVKTCSHIMVTGVPCGSPALRGEDFCYFHQRMIRTVKVPDSRLHHVALLENEEAIQASIMEIVNALIRGTIELRRGELILRALNTAVRNSRRARFHGHSRQMVKEIPDYEETPQPETEPAPKVNPPPTTSAELSKMKTEAPAAKTKVGTAALGCPGGPEVSGRSPAQPSAPPVMRRPPASVKQAAVPTQRKTAAHNAGHG